MGYVVALREYSRRRTWTRVGQGRYFLSATEFTHVDEIDGKKALNQPEKFLVISDKEKVNMLTEPLADGQSRTFEIKPKAKPAVATKVANTFKRK